MRRIRGDVPELTWDQLLELVCGTKRPDDRDDDVFIAECSNFASEEERRAAWGKRTEKKSWTSRATAPPGASVMTEVTSPSD